MRGSRLPLTVLLGAVLCIGCREPVVRTHAFSHSLQNYDANLVSIEIAPTESSVPVGGECTLIATVLDKEGKPAAGKRVEWIICRSPNGVGEIIAVDESGIFLADRGSKLDNVAAVTYTNQFDHVLKKAQDGGVDFDTLVGKHGPNEIKRGQTWTTISAAAEGETHVMVYAPGIRSSAKGRAFAVICWEKSGKK